MLRKQSVALLLLALGVGRPALAQAGTQGGQDHSWPKLDLNVLVVDKTGQPQALIDKSAFHVFENGAERPIESIIAGDTPVSLAFLIDTSGSMYDKQATNAGHDRRAAIAALVTDIIRALPTGSEVMAVLFADQAFIDLPFTSAEPAPLAFLGRLDDRGGTAFYDALVATENYVSKSARYPKRALVVLSDGDDNRSTLSLQNALRKIEQERPPTPTLYFVDLLDPRAGFAERRHSEVAVKFLISAGGGVPISAGKQPDPAALATRITALIRSQYLFSITAAEGPRDGGYRKLEVRVEPAGLESHAMPGYFAPIQ